MLSINLYTKTLRCYFNEMRNVVMKYNRGSSLQMPIKIFFYYKQPFLRGGMRYPCPVCLRERQTGHMGLSPHSCPNGKGRGAYPLNPLWFLRLHCSPGHRHFYIHHIPLSTTLH